MTQYTGDHGISLDELLADAAVELRSQELYSLAAAVELVRVRMAELTNEVERLRVMEEELQTTDVHELPSFEDVIV